MRSIMAFCSVLSGLYCLLLVNGATQTEVISNQTQQRELTSRPVDSHTQILNGLGILADGKTDCAQAIQRAIDHSRGTLFFPRGIYRLTKTVTIDLNRVGRTAIYGDGTARFVMAGAGPAFRFVGTHAGTADPGTVKPHIWKKERTPTVEGIEIIGDHPEASGIEADGTMQLTISRVVVRQAKHGIHLVGRNRNVIISECQLYENSGVGLFLDKLNLHQINVCNSHISYNAGGGIVLHQSNICNLQIGTCDIEANMGALHSPPTANILIDSTGSLAAEIAIVGCTIQHTGNAPQSANIRINNQSLKRKYTSELRSGNITIADNILSDVQVNLDIKNSRGVTVTGNTFWQGFEHDLNIENCQSIVVANNVFDRSPRTHAGRNSTANNGVLINNSSDCSFTGNLIQQTGDIPAAVVIKKCNRINISNCTLLDYQQGGLLLENVADSRVSDCIIRNDLATHPKTYSIKNIHGDNNLMVDNLLNSQN